MTVAARRPGVMVATAAVLFAGVAVTTVALTRESGPVFEPATELGPDPFVDVPVRPVPIRFQTLDAISSAADTADARSAAAGTGRADADDPPGDPSGDGGAGPADTRPGSSRDAMQAAERRIDAIVSTADRHGVPVIAPASPTGAAIYGGSGDEACNPDALIRFLVTHPEQARAWASVHGIAPAEIPGFIRDLTAGWLLADTRVTNHGFQDGRATPRESVLEAGTAVLVDDEGVPRARCRCGNPLRPALAVHDGTVFPDGDRSFADRVRAVRPSPEVDAQYRRPQEALGPPDGWFEHSYSIGTATRTCEFSVELEFVDNRLEAGPGNDLRIFETGHVERSDVFISADGDVWRDVGEVQGATDELDIDGVAEDGEEFRFVRICDFPDEEESDSPGADIDAVGAINSVNR
jgi:hypothetical protein